MRVACSYRISATPCLQADRAARLEVVVRVDGGCELAAQPLPRLVAGAEAVEPVEGRADHGRRVGRVDRDRPAHLREAVDDRTEEACVARAQQPSAEDDLDRVALE